MSSLPAPSYRAYFVGTDGHIIGREDLICAGDAEAIELATKLTDEHAVEVWDGDRLVTKLACQKPSK
ncbi:MULTISPECIES: hypothetical protein [Bradyrhizobium]|uniref:hypothetical protein n=1 Tax=Bradyrhizobium TaxID=374 RepID=UPI00140BB316|nr:MULTISPECIES: hypothetical protein [Bradyrhizobium]MCK7664575.1 hypothetical protein [Bradyrhizobium sp. 2S1]UGY25476.1 hypothetical protein HU675_0000540 [Bradyrhizobium septentrionale]